MGYFKDTISGITWMGALRAATRVVAFIKLAVLARLLTPGEFGLFGIAGLVLAFLEIATETGVNVFLIQEEAKLEIYNATSWLVSIARGILIALLILILSPFIASFFKSPSALGIIMLIALVPVIRGFVNPAVVKFQKELLFAKEFWFRFTIFAIDGIVAITLAFITKSAVSLVWGMIAGALVELVISHTLIKPRASFGFDLEKIKKILGRGKWVTLYLMFNYLYENGDNIVVGRIMETTSLGLYQMAYKISSLPITEIGDVVIRVTFPVYVKISGDLARLKRAYLKTLGTVTLLVLPFSIFLLVFAEPFVRIVLGEKWLLAVPVIKVLSFLGFIRTVTATSYPLLLSLKKQKYVSIITLVGILGLALTIIPLVRSQGIVGAGISALLGASLSLPVAFYFVYKTFKQ